MKPVTFELELECVIKFIFVTTRVWLNFG